MMKILLALFTILFTCNSLCWSQENAQLIKQSLAKVKENATPLSNDPVEQILKIQMSYEQNYQSLPRTNITGHGFIVFGINHIDGYDFLQKIVGQQELPVYWDASINRLENVQRTRTDLPDLFLEKEPANVAGYLEGGEKRKQVISEKMKQEGQFILCTNIFHAAEQLDEVGESTIGLFIDEVGKIHQKTTLNVAVLPKEHALQKELSAIRSSDEKMLINTLNLRLYRYNKPFQEGLSSQLLAYINLFDALILL